VDVPPPVCVLGIRLKPSSSRERITAIDEKAVTVAVAAAPVDGKANDALVKFLAKKLDVAKSSIVIRRGKTSRMKVVEIFGMNKTKVMEKLWKTFSK